VLIVIDLVSCLEIVFDKTCFFKYRTQWCR